MCWKTCISAFLLLIFPTVYIAIIPPRHRETYKKLNLSLIKFYTTQHLPLAVVRPVFILVVDPVVLASDLRSAGTSGSAPRVEINNTGRLLSTCIRGNIVRH